MKDETFMDENSLVTNFESPKKVRNAASSILILFLLDSEVFEMVCFAIVARLDPAH